MSDVRDESLPTAAPTTRLGSPLITVVVLCFGGMSAALMQTLVIPIQSELPRLLGTTAGNASWVVTATLLAAAVTMPISGRLADLFGKQRVLVVSSVVLVLGSLVCALSDTLTPLLVGRVLQGAAMGFIPVGISLMREVVPPRMASTAVAAMSATLGVGGAIGLPLSAWIAQDFDWHALFWTSVGLALVMVVTVLVLVPHVHDAHGGRLDVVGALGLGVGLVGVLVAVSKGNEWGWTDARTLWVGLGGVVVLLAWGAWELRVDEPLCDLRTNARPAVLLTNVAAVAIGFGMMAQSIVVPQLLQLPKATGYGLGQTVLEAGLWMAPAGLMMLLFAPISSTLMGRIGAKRTLMIGGFVLGAGYVVARFMMDAPWQLLVASLVATAGVGIGYAAMPTLILDAVDPRESGSAVGINALMRSVGTSAASAVMAALLTSDTQALGPAQVPTKAAFALCFIVGAAAAFVGVLLAATIPSGRRADRTAEEDGGAGALPEARTRSQARPALVGAADPAAGTGTLVTRPWSASGNSTNGNGTGNGAGNGNGTGSGAGNGNGTSNGTGNGVATDSATVTPADETGVPGVTASVHADGAAEVHLQGPGEVRVAVRVEGPAEVQVGNGAEGSLRALESGRHVVEHEGRHAGAADAETR